MEAVCLLQASLLFELKLLKLGIHRRSLKASCLSSRFLVKAWPPRPIEPLLASIRGSRVFGFDAPISPGVSM